MRIEELKTFSKSRISHHHDAMEELRSLGFKKIGNVSSFAHVFYHPNLNYILKLFEKDDGYIEFYKLAIQHQNNPHFPKFRGKMMKVNKRFYAIRIEKLTELANSPSAEPIFRGAQAYLRANGFSGSYIEQIKNEFPLFLEALDIIKDCLNTSNVNLRFDLHNENIMMRGECPVITDPFGEFSCN